jgi:hypothetical protein
MRLRTVVPSGLGLAALAIAVCGILLSGSGPGPAAAASLPALPAGWPTTLQLGMSDSPGGAAQMKATAPFGFRYQYLAGGANTGSGWSTWNPSGAFATYYIQDSVANAIVPVFTYYMIRQSAPGNAQDEASGVANNLQNQATMAAYFNDLKLFFQRAGAFPSNLVVLHVEPDMWGYVQQRSTGDNAATFSAQVASTGLPELAALPNTMGGFARAVVRLRDLYAPNVKLGYHLSYWGTGTDPLYSKPSDAQIDALAARSAAFYTSLGANFDLAFAEFSDRDAGFYQYVYGNPNAWWAPADFARNVRYLSDFVALTAKRVVMWQIPYGNTKMRAMNNTWNHYQDNRPEWLLDDPARAHLADYVNAGVVALLFGGGAGGVTCSCDAARDGVTNPAPINGNTGLSLSADDDGGYFRSKAQAYYGGGAMSLSGGGGSPTATSTPTTAATGTPTNTQTNTPANTQTNTPTKTPTPANTPTTAATKTATPKPTATPVAGWTTSAFVSPLSMTAGASVTITASIRSGSAANALVDVEVYGPNGTKVFQKYYDNRAFAAGVTQNFVQQWTVPGGSARGTYTVKIGVFSPGWGTLYTWNNGAASFTVQ